MCDPFNTKIEDALWDERRDLDPFMAEHYVSNAQYELNRLTASQPFSARTARVRRLHANYSVIAATAQLPEDSDFDEPDSTEEVETERLDFVHPDRLAQMNPGHEAIAPPVSQARGRSPENVSTNANNSVVSRNTRKRRRSRESSVESIIREDGFDSRGHYHHDHVDRNQSMRGHDAALHDYQLAAPFSPLQAPIQLFQPPWPYGGNTYYYAPTITVVNNYYGFAPPQQPQYGFGDDGGQDASSGGDHGSHGRRRRGRRRGRDRPHLSFFPFSRCSSPFQPPLSFAKYVISVHQDALLMSPRQPHQCCSPRCTILFSPSTSALHTRLSTSVAENISSVPQAVTTSNVIFSVYMHVCFFSSLAQKKRDMWSSCGCSTYRRIAVLRNSPCSFKKDHALIYHACFTLRGFGIVQGNLLRCLYSDKKHPQPF
ncbi:hypothetical protein KCU65_g455, partial [Aureobasidium melanogenum]